MLPAYRRAARSQPCPHCGAGTGSPCRTPRGRPTYEHTARSRITRAALNIGYEEGLRDAIAVLGRRSTVGLAAVREQLVRNLDLIAEDNQRVVREGQAAARQSAPPARSERSVQRYTHRVMRAVRGAPVGRDQDAKAPLVGLSHGSEDDHATR
ncbi:zinc finger domain-containing protein [Nocardioides dongkuii]